MQKNNQKILIVGAGFAGLNAAYWLGRQGHQVVVVERSAALRDSGAQVDLRTHGVEIVKRMGLLEAVAAHHVPEAGFERVDKDGHVKTRMMANTSGRGTRSITAEYEIMRGTILRLFYDAAKVNAEFRFDTMLERFEQDEKQVTAHFVDGSSDTFDLLIGADGQGSRIRRAILPPGAPDPYRRSGVSVAYWIVPRIASDTNVATMYNAPGGRLIIRRSHSETETQIYFFLRDESPEARGIHRKPVEEQKQFWAKHLQGAGWETDRFLDALESSDNFYCQEIVQIVSERWHEGRVVLLGDSAHGLPPMGWGVTSSVTGAYILAHELERNADRPAVAFANYEREMRPFIKSVAPPNLAFMRLLTPNTPMGIRVSHSVSGVARYITQNISKINARRSTSTGEGRSRGDWKLPDY